MNKLLSLFLLIFSCISSYSQSDITNSVILNPGFEDGVNTNWDLIINDGSASLLNAESSDIAVGENTAKINITDAEGIWKMWLESTSVDATNISGQELTFSFKSKKISDNPSTANIQKIMLRVEADGTNILGFESECWFAAEGEYQTFERTVEIPDNTNNLKIKIWCGQQNGSIFLDDFKVMGNQNNPNLLSGSLYVEGEAVFGNELIATLNDANSSLLNYQWKKNATDIENATQNNYTITADDIGSSLTIEVTADDKEGSISYTTSTVLETPAEYNPVFEKLKKGINQDTNLPYSGTFSKIQHEPEHMQAIKAAGFESVRIFLPYAADYTKFESRIQDALDNDLAVVVCMWGSTSWANNISTGVVQFRTKWEQIAQAWKNEFSDEVVFELLNEPKGIGFVEESSYPDVMALYNTAIPAIRAIDPNRPILVGMPGHNDSEYMDPWVSETYLDYVLNDGSTFFDDKNMGVAIHFYRPNGEDGNNWAFYTASQLNTGWQSTIDYQLDHAVNWQNIHSTNMPIIITEWGCWLFESRNNSSDLVDWLDYHVQKFEEYNFGSMWYTGIQNNQRQFAIFDSEFGWNQVVLEKLTGISNPNIPSTSQIIDSEFINWGSETWNLSCSSGVTKSFVGGISALSGSHSVKLVVNNPTNCQMYQRTLTEAEDGGQAPGRTLIHLVQGQTYEINFMAKAENSDGELKVMMKDAQNLETIFFESDPVIISTSPDTYVLTYTHNLPSALDVQFEFEIGLKTQMLFLDKVSLKKQNTLSIAENALYKVRVYPNPTNNILNFECKQKIKTVGLIDITGKKLMSIQNEYKMTIKYLDPGVYFVRITFEDNQTVIKRIIKK